jgi:hypothetical protein
MLVCPELGHRFFHSVSRIYSAAAALEAAHQRGSHGGFVVNHQYLRQCTH